VFSNLLQTGADEAQAAHLAELALACGVNATELAVAVACWAFSSDNRGGLPEVQTLVGKQRLALLADSVASVAALVSTFPRIPGTNHARLGFYFTTLRQLASSAPTSESSLVVHSADHQKLLSRLLTISPPIDFSRLIDAEQEPLAVLSSCLSPANVHSLAKLIPLVIASRGSDRHSKVLSTSSVYFAWVNRLIWPEHLADESVPLIDKARSFGERFTAAKEFISKLSPEDAARCAEMIFLSASLIETKAAAVAEALKTAQAQGAPDGSPSVAILLRLRSSASELLRLRTLLPGKLQDEYDCAVLSKSSARAGLFVSLCEGVVRAGMPSGVLYDLGVSLQWPVPHQEIAELYGALCESTLCDKLPLPSLLASIVSSVSGAQEHDSLARASFCAACQAVVVHRAKDFVNGSSSMAARIAVLELLE
jgi:hypothetical protein